MSKKDKTQKGLSRRDFLKIAGTGSAGFAFGTVGGLDAAALLRQDAQKVEVWTGFGQGRMADALTGALEQFAMEHPEYAPEHVVVPWGEIHDQAIAATAAGNPPDSYRGWAWIVGDDASIGALTNLSPFIEAQDVDLTDFWEPTLDQMTYQDSVYAMSISTIVNPLYYNRDRMREAGFDPEDLPTSLEGWEEIGEGLTEVTDSGEIEKVGFVPMIPSADHYSWLAAFGGNAWDEENQEATVNTPEMQEVFAWFKSYDDKYGLDNIEAWASTYGGNGFGRNTPDGVYYTGLLSVWTIGSWLHNDMGEYGADVDFGVVGLPSPMGVENGRPGRLTANMYFVPEGANNVEGGFAFANFMSSSPWVAINKAVVDSVTPSRRSLAELPEVEDAAPWIPLMRDEVLPFAMPEPAMAGARFMNRTIGEALETVRFEDADIEETLADAQARIERELR